MPFCGLVGEYPLYVMIIFVHCSIVRDQKGSGLGSVGGWIG